MLRKLKYCIFFTTIICAEKIEILYFLYHYNMCWENCDKNQKCWLNILSEKSLTHPAVYSTLWLSRLCSLAVYRGRWSGNWPLRSSNKEWSASSLTGKQSEWSKIKQGKVRFHFNKKTLRKVKKSKEHFNIII